MKSLADLKKMRDASLKNIEMRFSKGTMRIQVGMGTCGIAAGARPILSQIIEDIEAHKLKDIIVTQVGCMGECAYEPIVELIDADGNHTIYCEVTVDKIKEIITSHVIDGQVIEKYVLYKTKK
ncbi:MAG: (2Fe-2S) ferredoxin domain-containing protein [Acholeplasmataceae bacterium]